MLKRYTREVMGRIWTLENRFKTMLEVEKAAARAQGKLKLIPIKSAQTIEKKADFSLKNILKKEQTTRHDVTAFVQTVAERVGRPHGSFVHWGLTSSDVLDTALALQIHRAGLVLRKSFKNLKTALVVQIKRHSKTLCAGRTHGQLAEPITFGLKLLGYLMELKRNESRVEKALEQTRIGKLSGAVGAYAVLSPAVEKQVCQDLGLNIEPAATQVIPRDRYAELILALALTAGGLERLAVEIRHLQRTEVGELTESFTKGQTGSSAMPHKKNPIYSENITGLSRLLRSYTQPVLENIVLWHERDISHSSVERVIFPSAFILCDFALNRMAEVIKNLQVDAKKMKENMQKQEGLIFSSSLLAFLIKKGMPREQAYKLAQSLALSLKPEESFKKAVEKNNSIKQYLKPKELDEVFSMKNRTKEIHDRIKFLIDS